MFRNYIKTAYRSLLRNKVYSIINIAGLTLGISVCLLIFQIIRYELSFDKGNSNAARIYRVVHDMKNASGIDKSTVTPYPFSEAFRNDFPDIPVTQFHFQYESLLKVGDVKSEVTNIAFADSLFFELLGFEVISGNPKVELSQPGKVFVTESYLKRIGGEKVKTIKLGNILELEVVGVIKDQETPSHIQANMVASYSSLKGYEEEYVGFPLDQWGLNSSGYSYILLPDHISKEKLEDQFQGFVKKYYSAEDAPNQTYRLQALSDVHFDEEYKGNPGTAASSISLLLVLGCIAIFILIIACVNFINLSTALSIRRGKEVGVRKTMGAQQQQLSLQFLSEAFVLTLISAVVSLGLAELTTPLLSQFLEKNINSGTLHDSFSIGFLLLLILFTSLLAGSYPSWVLSRFTPVEALKNRFTMQHDSSVSLRKTLVVVQFFIAQVLIICTLIVSSQISFFKNKSLGFAENAIINVQLPENKSQILENFRGRLAAAGFTQSTFALSAPMGDYTFGTGIGRVDAGVEERYSVRIKPVDIHYKDVYDLELVAGRWFTDADEKSASLEDEEARKYGFVLSEKTVRELGYESAEEAIDKNVILGLNDIEAPIIGVIKDFHTSSLHNELEAVVLLIFPGLYYDAGISIDINNATEQIAAVEKIWSEVYPEYMFKYTFLDDYIARLYREEERMFIVFEGFAGIAIFIGCLGLFGLVSFMANQKTKEVAIRKTLGANTIQIVKLFSVEFIWLVLIAFALSVPFAWYSMNLWLSEFAYQVEMNVLIFVAGIFITLLITLTTVGYRSWYAAKANPVNALKSE